MGFVMVYCSRKVAVGCVKVHDSCSEGHCGLLLFYFNNVLAKLVALFTDSLTIFTSTISRDSITSKRASLSRSKEDPFS